MLGNKLAQVLTSGGTWVTKCTSDNLVYHQGYFDAVSSLRNDPYDADFLKSKNRDRRRTYYWTPPPQEGGEGL